MSDYPEFEQLSKDCANMALSGIKVCDAPVRKEADQLARDLARLIVERKPSLDATVIALSALLSTSIRDMVDPLPPESVQ